MTRAGVPVRARIRTARSAAGFTLVEIVVAFVLLSGVLVVGFEIFSQGLRRAGQLDDQARALVIAQSKLAAAGTEEKFEEGQHQGEEGRFRWTVAIQRSEEGMGAPGQPPNSAYQLFRVDVRVEWIGVDSRARAVSLSTLGLGSRI
ncbi:MAG TPA: hypothetical protein VEC19_00100 [Usitatibacter sp.]|nr:hypothetical protein [Usitatibacter sp.]